MDDLLNGDICCGFWPPLNQPKTGTSINVRFTPKNGRKNLQANSAENDTILGAHANAGIGNKGDVSIWRNVEIRIKFHSTVGG